MGGDILICEQNLIREHIFWKEGNSKIVYVNKFWYENTIIKLNEIVKISELKW